MGVYLVKLIIVIITAIIFSVILIF